MFPKPIPLSLTRITDFDGVPFDIQTLNTSVWETGDYVVGEVLVKEYRPRHELPNGRMMEAARGDLFVGALGVRAATLEVAGDWRSIGADAQMQSLTAAGLLGRATSVSPFVDPPVDLAYRGHVARHGAKLNMRDFVPSIEEAAYDIPTILLIGTSMSSGKTTTAKAIIRELKYSGLKVAGVKLTGAGRYRDILAMRDSGADWIFDFVDVGLPSTVCPAPEYRKALKTLLGMIVRVKPEVVVAEAGASPCEPYNGEVAIEEIHQQIKMTMLCASDPYAVVGVTEGFGFKPDFATGLAASTTAGVAVIKKLSGVKAINITDPDSIGEVRELLKQRIGAR